MRRGDAAGYVGWSIGQGQYADVERLPGKSSNHMLKVCVEEWKHDSSDKTPKPPRKASKHQLWSRPYRKPSLVGRGKYPKVNERSSVKELGKLTPYLRKKGCLGRVMTQAV